MFESTQMALLQKPQQCNSDFKEVEREGKRNENIQTNKLLMACVSHLQEASLIQIIPLSPMRDSKITENHKNRKLSHF